MFVCVLSVHWLLFITSHIKIMIKLSLPVIEVLTSLSFPPSAHLLLTLSFHPDSISFTYSPKLLPFLFILFIYFVLLEQHSYILLYIRHTSYICLSVCVSVHMCAPYRNIYSELSVNKILDFVFIINFATNIIFLCS